MWASLARLGVRDADLEDLMQEVFIVVHRRLDTFKGDGAFRSWLYSICRRTVSNYRRRAHYQHERTTAPISELEIASEQDDPEEAAVANEAKRRLDLVLDQLSDDKRVVFVMFEIELKSSAEIARTLGIPVGTVHSRIHAARHDVERAAARLNLLPAEKKIS